LCASVIVISYSFLPQKSFIIFQLSFVSFTGNQQNNAAEPGRFYAALDPNRRRPRIAQAGPEQPIEWHEYTIPPLWKRFLAEFIDFVILFVLKIVVTFIAVDWFDMIDLDRYT
jgi:hypothetical protein